MSEKIVQLIDDDGDNIYPIASVPHGASITMTTTDPGEGTPLAEDHYVAVYGEPPVILDYSTDEVDTGTRWIDGSTVYKKTIEFGALPNEASKSVPHNITNLGEVIEITGFATFPSGSRFPLPFVAIATTGRIQVVCTNTSVLIETATNRSTGSAYITLYYTKSS